MLTRFLVVVALLAGPTDDGSKKGRRANGLYDQEQYQPATQLYREGLAGYEDQAPDAVYYGLQNNLGAALYKQENYKTAEAAFKSALETASSDADYARSSYNAGNNAARSSNLEGALDHYRNALLADPANQDAKFNYEFVKRQLDQQQQQQQQNQDGENDEDENQEQQNNQQNQHQQQQDENQQEQQNQDQQDQQQEEDGGQQEQQTQPQESDQEQLSRQQAERILQALENEEEELLREVQKVKGRPRRVEKDW